MSIDAKVQDIYLEKDGTGELVLSGRKSGEHPGQTKLKYQKAPYNIMGLKGLDIWGDSANIMLGNTKIARRLGYTRIEFINDDALNYALELNKIKDCNPNKNKDL